jgi:hypothetical protein
MWAELDEGAWRVRIFWGGALAATCCVFCLPEGGAGDSSPPRVLVEFIRGAGVDGEAGHRPRALATHCRAVRVAARLGRPQQPHGV